MTDNQIKYQATRQANAAAKKYAADMLKKYGELPPESEIAELWRRIYNAAAGIA